MIGLLAFIGAHSWKLTVLVTGVVSWIFTGGPS